MKVCFLLSLIEREHLDLDDGYYMDLYDKDSAFTRLFFDREQLKVTREFFLNQCAFFCLNFEIFSKTWIEFISKSGQEQEDYLDSLDGDLANLSIEDDEFELDEDFLMPNREPEVREDFRTTNSLYDGAFRSNVSFNIILN